MTAPQGVTLDAARLLASHVPALGRPNNGWRTAKHFVVEAGNDYSSDNNAIADAEMLAAKNDKITAYGDDKLLKRKGDAGADKTTDRCKMRVRADPDRNEGDDENAVVPILIP